MTEDRVGLSESGVGVLFLANRELSSCLVQSSVVLARGTQSNRPQL